MSSKPEGTGFVQLQLCYGCFTIVYRSILPVHEMRRTPPTRPSSLHAEHNCFGNRYLRYVDDIVLVLPAAGAKSAEDSVVGETARLGLCLNQDKRVQVACADWLRSNEDTPADDIAQQWKIFAGGLRRRLVTTPASQPALDRRLRTAGFRIPLTSYEQAATDAGWWLRLRELVGFQRFWSGVRHLSEEDIVRNALRLREAAEESFFRLAESAQSTAGIQRKRAVQHLRFLSSKLMMVAAPCVLPDLAQSLQGWPELLPQRAIFNALSYIPHFEHVGWSHVTIANTMIYVLRCQRLRVFHGACAKAWARRFSICRCNLR